MRLSRQAQYSIRTVLDLAQRPQGRLADIAARRGIPASYMARIVHGLSRAGLVRTYRGIGGGVRLARPAEAITLAEVIAAAEGPQGINLCVLWGDCPCPQPCPVRATLARLEGAVTRELQVTVGELAARWPPAAAERNTGARRRRTRRTRTETKGG